jgi:hypothetical protein
MTNQNTSMTHASIPPEHHPRQRRPGKDHPSQRRPSQRRPSQRRPSQRRPNRRGTILVLAAGSAAVCGLLAGCGATGATAGTDQAAPGDQSGESITLYSGQHEQTTNGLVTAFEKQTGIKVNVRNDDEDTLANLIAVQGSHTPADVFFTENSPPLEFLQEKGLLSKVSQATLADTPAKYNSPGGNWVGVSARVSVIVYNPSLISKNQLPTSVMQLADPKYKDKLGIAPGESTTAVLVTHDQDEALSVADRVAALRDGRIAQCAPPEDLYCRPADPRLASFIGEANLLEGVVSGATVKTLLGALPLDLAAAIPGAAGQVTVLIRPER